MTPRPTVAFATTNLIDQSRFEDAAVRAGYRVVPIDDPEDAPLVAFVDLEWPDAHQTIRHLASLGTRVVAYGPHVDSFALTRAMTLGADTAEPRSRVLRDPASFLPPIV